MMVSINGGRNQSMWKKPVKLTTLVVIGTDYITEVDVNPTVTITGHNGLLE